MPDDAIRQKSHNKNTGYGKGDDLPGVAEGEAHFRNRLGLYEHKPGAQKEEGKMRDAWLFTEEGRIQHKCEQQDQPKYDQIGNGIDAMGHV